MSEKVTITLTNEPALRARFAEIVRKLEQPGELLDRIGGLLEQNIQLRFDTKTAPDGSAWLPLSPVTLEMYREKYDGNIPGSLLQRTRHMRDSLTHNAGDEFVEVGFGDKIAAFHEFGTRRMPRRQLLTDDPVAGTLAESDRAEILAEIEDYLRSL